MQILRRFVYLSAAFFASGCANHAPTHQNTYDSKTFPAIGVIFRPPNLGGRGWSTYLFNGYFDHTSAGSELALSNGMYSNIGKDKIECDGSFDDNGTDLKSYGQFSCSSGIKGSFHIIFENKNKNSGPGSINYRMDHLAVFFIGKSKHNIISTGQILPNH